jgi:uncharacterized protein (DUF924 family)
MIEKNPEKIVNFWFSDRVEKLWYNSTPEFDNEVEQKFSSDYSAACNGELDHWKTSEIGCLALIILFDQYPLNVFRNNKQSFVTEKQAIDIAKHCVEQGLDKKLTKTQRSFIYMPFIHSEDIADQKLSIELFQNLDPENTKFAKHHFDIVEKYGRFPHRNKILGRESSSDEIDYLSSKEAFTG